MVFLAKNHVWRPPKPVLGTKKLIANGLRVANAVGFKFWVNKLRKSARPFPWESPPRPHPHNHKMGHLPSLRAEHALGAVFCPLGPRGYHFKPLFREFPATFRTGTKKSNKSAKTDVRSYESWHFRPRTTLGGLQNQFWAPKNNCKWPVC